MLGSQSGFVTRIKHRSPNVVGAHCIFHRGALASRTLHAALNDKLATAIPVVNFVKTGSVKSRLFTDLCKGIDADHETLLFHMAVRWLSKGNMLARVYELKTEVKLFLEAQGNQNHLHLFRADGFQLTLTNLVDIFEALNCLNRHCKSSHTNRIDHYDSIRTFTKKFELWFRRVQRGNVASFSNLDVVFEKNRIDLDAELKPKIEAHVQSLKQEIERYFPDLANTGLSEWKLAKNPFRVEMGLPPYKIQEEFLELKCNSVAKDDFETKLLSDFCAEHVRV